MIPYIIIALSIAAWLVPPFKQRGTKYFLFFLFIALADPLAATFVYSHLLPAPQITVIIELLCVFALIKKNNINRIFILLISVTYLFVYKLFSLSEIRIFGILLQTIILLLIAYDFLLYIQEKKTLNLFYMILILYQVTLVMKFMAALIDVNFGMVQFYLTGFLEIIFAFMFMFININTKDFKIFKELEEA